MRRKKLLLTLLYGLAIAALGNLSADAKRIKYYWPRTTLSSLNALAFQQSGRSADVLFVGTSRFRSGINAVLLTDLLRSQGIEQAESFNVAQPGSRALRNAIMLRDVVATNGCPRVIVFEIGPGSVNQNGLWERDLGEFASLQDLPLLAGDLHKRDVLEGYLTSMVRGHIRWMDFLFDPPKKATLEARLAHRGSRWTEQPNASPPAAGPRPNRIRRNVNYFRRNAWRDYEIAGAPTNALRHAIDISHRCGSRLVFVRMPSLMWTDQRNIEAIDRPFLDFMSGVTEAHGVPFLDAEHALDFEPRHFRDPGHLNYWGSEILTRHLAKEVLPPMLRE